MSRHWGPTAPIRDLFSRKKIKTNVCPECKKEMREKEKICQVCANKKIIKRISDYLENIKNDLSRGIEKSQAAKKPSKILRELQERQNFVSFLVLPENFKTFVNNPDDFFDLAEKRYPSQTEFTGKLIEKLEIIKKMVYRIRRHPVPYKR